MRKWLAFILIFLTIPVLAHAETAWVKFTLEKRPFINPRTGNVVNIAGRKNRPRIDQFVGGGKHYPNLSGVKIEKWYENGTDLLVSVQGDQKAIDAIVKKSDFKPETKNKEQADKLKIDLFRVPVPVESGVTK